MPLTKVTVVVGDMQEIYLQKYHSLQNRCTLQEKNRIATRFRTSLVDRQKVDRARQRVVDQKANQNRHRAFLKEVKICKAAVEDMESEGPSHHRVKGQLQPDRSHNCASFNPYPRPVLTSPLRVAAVQPITDIPEYKISAESIEDVAYSDEWLKRLLAEVGEAKLVEDHI